jgi:hypothetical protein
MSSSKPKPDDGPAPGELQRVKSFLSTTLEWTIRDFTSWIESQNQNSGIVTKKSPPFFLRCGQLEVKLQLMIQIKENKDELGFYLRKLSRDEVDIKFQLKAIDKQGVAFGRCDMLQHQFTRAAPSWGYASFISIKETKEKADFRLHNRSLKLECDLTISDAEVSIEGYEGPKLKESLFKLHESVADFNILCDGQEFPCHKTILAAR